ncbi:hypothetical protein VIGAN_02204600 [Vigna angularis var. angularis]|uniref:Uncharacterized protein n=1 Tax=Vigna angularis var. angularis TaxID=157739 RepID=A0A0S3RF54_PHAAN|nr:hypothetical protein VIGAN_02204600 [Vigna angularis var. angularis]
MKHFHSLQNKSFVYELRSPAASTSEISITAKPNSALLSITLTSSEFLRTAKHFGDFIKGMLFHQVIKRYVIQDGHNKGSRAIEDLNLIGKKYARSEVSFSNFGIRFWCLFVKRIFFFYNLSLSLSFGNNLFVLISLLHTVRAMVVEVVGFETVQGPAENSAEEDKPVSQEIENRKLEKDAEVAEATSKLYFSD